jgi:hypothetical protein
MLRLVVASKAIAATNLHGAPRLKTGRMLMRNMRNMRNCWNAIKRSFFDDQLLLVGFAAALGSIGCDTISASNGSNNPAEATNEHRAELTLILGTATTISIRTAPNGVCDYRWQGVDSSQILLADDDGIARVSIEVQDLPAGADATGTVVLACNSESQRDNFRIELRWVLPGGKPTSSSDLVVIGDLQMPSDLAKQRPPLTGDPSLISQEELVRLGYPPRPDPVTSPAEYADWLTAAAMPLQIVSGKTMEMPGHYHSPTNATGTSDIWSGFVLSQAGVTYQQASSRWRVPTLSSTGLSCGLQYRSSLWAGIDGWGTNDLIQDGTAHTMWIMYAHGICFATTTYYAWVEYYPNAEVRVSSLAVAAGDLVQATAWSGDVNGNPSATGDYGWFNLVNVTRGTTYSGNIARPSGTTFVGRSAEWIMERPTVNSTVAWLANYGGVLPVRVGSLAALVYGSSAVHTLATDFSIQVTMLNGTSTMSTVSMVNSQTEDFTWVNWH